MKTEHYYRVLLSCLLKMYSIEVELAQHVLKEITK